MPTLSYGIKQEGIREGRKIGRIEGRLEGKLEGKLEGRQEGRQEATFDVTVTYIENLLTNGFDLNKTFELLNIKKELKDKVQEYFETK